VSGRPHRCLYAAAATALLTAALVLLAGQTALAHAVLEDSSPKDGSSVATLPDKVTLAFDENVATPAFVNVVAPDGTNVAVGSPAILDNTVTERVEPPGEAGTYRMSYRVVSADGHPVSATLTFQVTAGRHVAASSTSSTSESSHRGRVIALAIAGAVLVLALIALTRTARQSPRDDTSGPQPR
jgi:copper resistance protein C